MFAWPRIDGHPLLADRALRSPIEKCTKDHNSPQQRGSRFTRKERVAAGWRAIRTFAFEQSRSSSQVVFHEQFTRVLTFIGGGGGESFGPVLLGC